jgi:hypothetical protein
MTDNNDSEHDYTNSVEIQGRKAYKIAWLRLDEGGMINLYAPPLAYPVLRLFPTQRGMLNNVGIDPQDIGIEPFYANFYALYTANPHKLNARGNPYKDVVDLVPISAGTPDPLAELLNLILEELRDIRDYLYERVNPTRSQRPATLPPSPATGKPETGYKASERAEVPPQTEVSERKPLPYPNLPKEKEQLIAMLSAKRYVDCIAVLGVEAIWDRVTETDSREKFASAVRPRIVPAEVTNEQLETVCTLIAEEWTPEWPWKPMVIALAYYVNETGAGHKKSEVLLKAKGLYLSLS